MDRRRKEYMDEHYTKDPEKRAIAMEKRRNTIQSSPEKQDNISKSLKNAVTKWYSELAEKLEKIELVEEEDVIDFMKNNRDLYVGKSGNRKMIRDAPRMYKSLKEYTKKYEIYNYGKELPFVCQMDIIANGFNLTKDHFCMCGKTLKFNKITQKWDKFYCRNCRKSPTSKDHFKMKYGDGWEEKWSECMVHTTTIPKGKNEKRLLDDMEKLFNTVIQRDFSVKWYFPDGYSKDLNIVFEVNEKHHRLPSRRKRDNKRRKIIQEELKCDFVIIWDDTLEIERKKYVQA